MVLAQIGDGQAAVLGEQLAPKVAFVNRQKPCGRHTLCCSDNMDFQDG